MPTNVIHGPKSPGRLSLGRRVMQAPLMSSRPRCRFSQTSSPSKCWPRPWARHPQPAKMAAAPSGLPSPCHVTQGTRAGVCPPLTELPPDWANGVGQCRRGGVNAPPTAWIPKQKEGDMNPGKATGTCHPRQGCAAGTLSLEEGDAELSSVLC